jgi:toxin ParE1/3/4
MTSSLRLDLTADARADFRSILRYTRKTWGADQRKKYADRLDAAMEQLTRFPHLGESRDDLPVGMHACPVEQHVIDYRADEHAVIVIRLLHIRMDTRGQLDESFI